jgi:hypothetical protein
VVLSFATKNRLASADTMKHAVAAISLALCIYFLVTPHPNQSVFHFTSKFSKESRLPFHSRFIDARGQRVFISVHISNPTDANFALCVQQPGAELPRYGAPFSSFLWSHLYLILFL